MLVSLLIEDFLEDQLCVVVGPFSSVGGALGPAQHADIGFALLDVNVGGAKIYPVAEVLDARRIPFLFLSGYGSEAVPDERPEWRVCSKPFNTAFLGKMMIEQMNLKRQKAALTDASPATFGKRFA